MSECTCCKICRDRRAADLTAEDREALASGFGVIKDIRQRWPERMPWKRAGEIMDASVGRARTGGVQVTPLRGARITLTDVQVKKIDRALAALDRLLNGEK